MASTEGIGALLLQGLGGEVEAAAWGSGGAGGSGETGSTLRPKGAGSTEVNAALFLFVCVCVCVLVCHFVHTVYNDEMF